jgi:hypothetical protein
LHECTPQLALHAMGSEAFCTNKHGGAPLFLPQLVPSWLGITVSLSQWLLPALLQRVPSAPDDR